MTLYIHLQKTNYYNFFHPLKIHATKIPHCQALKMLMILNPYELSILHQASEEMQ